MHWTPIVLTVVFMLLPGLSLSRAADPGTPAAAKPRSAMALWDTGQPAAGALSPKVVAAQEGWKLLAQPESAAAFTGDAVLSNGRILIVFRKQGQAAEVYGLGSGQPAERTRLQLRAAGGEAADHLERLAVVENTRAAACLEAAYRTAGGATVTAKFRIKRGDGTIQVEPGAGAERLQVGAPGRFVVLPDFFADDILVDARALSPNAIELPSENFLAHLEGTGEALTLCVFENRKQDVKVALAGTGDQRTITASEISLEGKKVWVALIEGPQVWHLRELKASEVGKTLPLDWKMPFPASWRVDFTRKDGLTDSWEMLLPEEKGNGFIKPSWLGAGSERLNTNRQRWNTVLGSYSYPCWSDRQGQGYLQPVRRSVLGFQGPIVIYPINRVKETPLDAYTVVDVMRNTLGVGPCEYILDLEGQKAEYKGRATCSVRDSLRPIYERQQQKQKRAEIERILDDGLIFVTHIRGRITRYVEFGHKMRDYLAAQKAAHPELAEYLDEMDRVTREIDTRVAARVAKIKTPAHVAAMNEDFRKNVLDDDGPEALAKCKKYSLALVEIGDNQDELSGECRWVVKALRQKAGLMLALEPRAASVAAEIRTRTQEALRNPANHEGAHH